MSTVPTVRPGSKGAPNAYRHAATSEPDEEQPQFEAFFTRYEQPLCGYLRRMVPTNEVAVELAQEAFLRAWQHFAELQLYDRPEAWLYRVATNLAISHLRRRNSLCFAQLYTRTTDEGEPDTAAFESEFLAGPCDIEQQISDRVLIEQTFQQLAQRQRAALMLRMVYGLSCEEISGALGISVANVRQTLTRGRERFRKLYRAAS
ncbi:MAG: RNA polymerase sigma factor [Ktedonobacterales bacterium]